MTPERDPTQTGKSLDGTTSTPATREDVCSTRRALLRGASTALPAVLTLKSGAALAASSNLLGTVQYANQALGEGNSVQCLGYESAVGGTPAQLDLGPNPSLHVQYIPQRQYYLPKIDSDGKETGDWNKPVSIEYMCEKGGKYWYRADGTTGQPLKLVSTTGDDTVNHGFLVSATALASFTSNIDQKTIFL